MIKIEYPEYKYRIKTESEQEWIFDPVRKQWVILSPEEWVRQNFIQYLALVKKYSASLMAIEKEIRLGELSKRCDIVIYNKEAQPQMIVECKATHIELNSSVLDQILRYNMSIPVQYLIITNGHYCFGFERAQGMLQPLSEIPESVC
ncbi:MAG: restriction endonuclease subunit R [Bacteroidetes bacterium]|nr:MAG: restriction endonuclease subunit R [Bacteroidota bacterium]